MGKAVWGIDVSKFAVKAVKVEKVKDHLEVTALDVIEHPVPTGQEPVDTDQLIKDAINEILSRNKARGETLVFSMPGHATFNRFIKLPPVEAKRIPEIVRYEAQQHIPFPIDDVIWGYQPLSKEQQVGDETEVVIFAIKKDVVNQFLQNLVEAQIPIDVLQFAPVALYNFAIHDQELSGASIILDMGADNTDLIVVDGEKYWIRNLPIAGNDLTKALQKKFQIAFNEAEKLKISASQSQQAAKIFNVIQPVLRDLVAEIHRSIGYYKSLSKTVKFERVVLVGSASKTINFQKFISQNLQMDASKLTKLNKIVLSGKVNEPQFQKYFPSLGVALGLALQGHGMSANQINLLPSDMVSKKLVAQKKPFVAGIAACFAIMVIMMYVQASRQVAALTTQKTDVAAVIEKCDGIRGQVEAVKAEIPPIMEELSEIVAFVPERDLPIRVLNALNKILPKNNDPAVAPQDRIWILDLNYEEGSEDVKQPAPEGTLDESGVPITEIRVARALARVTVQVGLQARTKDDDAKVFDLPKSKDFIVDKLMNKFCEAMDVPVAMADIIPETEPFPELRAKDEESSTTGGGLGGPAGFGGGFGGGLGGGAPKKTEGKYYRFEISWKIPIGKEVREALKPKPAEGDPAASGS
ncbi:MAG: type IV pilus assembly protein PilM [Planctomycetes bacterium]|nr:type IV pilus assembly protein PilM [Planctomycetota bacterium]